MRKLIFQEWLSMDGYAADANGSVRFIESHDKYSDQDQLKFLDSIPKIIFSRSMTTAPWGKWPAAAVSTDAVGTVKKLKAQQGKDIVLWGSISIDRMGFELFDTKRYETGIMLLQYRPAPVA